MRLSRCRDCLAQVKYATAAVQHIRAIACADGGTVDASFDSHESLHLVRSLRQLPPQQLLDLVTMCDPISDALALDPTADVVVAATQTTASSLSSSTAPSLPSDAVLTSPCLVVAIVEALDAVAWQHPAVPLARLLAADASRSGSPQQAGPDSPCPESPSSKPFASDRSPTASSRPQLHSAASVADDGGGSRGTAARWFPITDRDYRSGAVRAMAGLLQLVVSDGGGGHPRIGREAVDKSVVLVSPARTPTSVGVSEPSEPVTRSRCAAYIRARLERLSCADRVARVGSSSDVDSDMASIAALARACLSHAMAPSDSAGGGSGVPGCWARLWSCCGSGSGGGGGGGGGDGGGGGGGGGAKGASASADRNGGTAGAVYLALDPSPSAQAAVSAPSWMATVFYSGAAVLWCPAVVTVVAGGQSCPFVAAATAGVAVSTSGAT